MGGGGFCKRLLQFFLGDLFRDNPPIIRGVADRDETAEGLLYAKANGIFTCSDYRDLINLEGLDLIIELTHEKALGNTIRDLLPPEVKLIDHVEARLLWDQLLIEQEKYRIFKKITADCDQPGEVTKLFESFSSRLSDIVYKRNISFRILERELRSQEETLAQIIQGSTIPTFVINSDHVVTHWNRALEKLTGFSAREIVGTDKHWKPFRSAKRPIMADVILDRFETDDVDKYYGKKWRKSGLINGAFEADEFFPHLGENGRWLFFTAAPIKSHNGTIVGAIETLWDTTEDRKAQEERKKHIKKIEESEKALYQIIQGSTIPTFVINSDHVVTHWNRALEKLTGFAAHQMVGTRNQWKSFRSSKRPLMADIIVDGLKSDEIAKYYGKKWRKSALIDGGYEAEHFFPNLGEEGRWLFFTAAPIKSARGKLIGAIETLWDTTEDKKAQEERKKHTREIEESERELAQIIQGSTVPTFVINSDHIVTNWNRALENLTGWQSFEIVGTNKQWAPFWESERPSMADVILDQIGEDEIKRLYGETWRKSALIEGAYEAEMFFPKLGENGRWCWFTAAPIIGQDNEVIGAIETLLDTTDQKKAKEEQLRHAEELTTLCSIYTALNAPLSLNQRIQSTVEEIRSFISSERVCIFIMEKEDGFSLKYSACAETYDSQSCHLDNEMETIRKVAEADRSVIFNDVAVKTHENGEIAKDNQLSSMAYIPISAKERRGFGVLRICRKSGRFSEDERHLLELIGNRIGVTIENTLLQEEIKRKSEFQSKLIKSSNEGIVATDDKWNVITYNPAAESIFGYERSEIVQKINAMDIYPEAVAEMLKKKIKARSLVEDVSWHETTINAKNNEKIPVKFTGTLLREADETLGTVAFFQDLREVKRLERELVQSERLAAVGQTVAGMAHCIKNILHGFKGGSYLVNIGMNKDNTEKLKDGWGMIQRNITRTSDLVMDLLSYSKEREPEPENCFPNEIADDVCELLREIADENDVAIEKKFSPDVGEVVMDHRTLHRCLMNLTSNAIDACIFDPDVDKNHKVTVETILDPDHYLKFRVKDNGSGMDEYVRKRLFKSFFSTKGAKGTGLGLLVTGKLIEENNGTIDVESAIGEGTTFTIRLPYETAA